MIAQEDQPTAVITCNNLLSKGYLQAVCEHTHGKTDLYTHIGLDEIDMMQYLGIPYNCIQRDAYELGRSAAELLMKRIEPEEAYQHMILSSPLIHQTF
jgi:LacI family transcriptional regulator